MVKLHKINLLGLLLVILGCSSVQNKTDLQGKYYSISENQYDNFKDTIEIKSNDDGKFDVQRIANWSAAKKDDPDRPAKNKKAGEWISYGPGKIEIATFQQSDNTLRIEDPMSGTVKIMIVNFKEGTIKKLTKDGDTTIYHKIN